MIGWTLFNLFCLVICLVFMFGCDKSYLSKLLGYDVATAVYIFSLVNALRAIPWETNRSEFFPSLVLCAFAVVGSLFVYITSMIIMIMYNGLPNIEFVKKYIEIDRGNPRISYKLFKQMYALHPDKFHFSDYSWCYRTEAFSLSFLDYIRASLLIESEEHGRKSKSCRKDYQRLVSEMQADLEKDLLAARKEKEQAFQEIENATKDANELFKALSKYN